RNLDRIRGDGVLAFGGGGEDSIFMYDENSGFSGTYTLGFVFLTRAYQTVDRPGAFADVWYAGFTIGPFTNTALYGSAGATTFDIQYVARGGLSLSTGAGANTVDVHETTGSLNIDTGGGDDLVRISPAARNDGPSCRTSMSSGIPCCRTCSNTAKRRAFSA